jgi:glycosyltransferase involved in cell wall biosynthesis
MPDRPGSGRPATVLMIHDYPPLTGGGLAAGVRELAAGLATGYRVIVLSARLADHFGDDRRSRSRSRSSSSSPSPSPSPSRPRPPAGRFPPAFRVGGLIQLVRLARDADLLVAHWTFSFRRLATAALLLGPRLGTPTVLVFHTAPEHLRFNRLSWLPAGARARLLRLLARALRPCAAVVALGPAHAARLRAAGLPVTRVLPLPVRPPDPPPGGPPASSRGRPSGSRLVVGVAGELSRLKGTHLLPDLLAALTPAVHFHVAGAGPMLARLRRAVARLDPPRRAAVVLAGRLAPEAMPAYYRSLDVLLLLSGTEARPRVIVEAMQAGVVVVAPATDWAADLVVDGDTGVLFDRADPHACRRCLAGLAGDPPRRRRLARRAAARAAALAGGDLTGWRALVGGLTSGNRPGPAGRNG